MPAPSTEVFDRLRQLAAIKDTTARQTKTIDEIQEAAYIRVRAWSSALIAVESNPVNSARALP